MNVDPAHNSRFELKRRCERIVLQRTKHIDETYSTNKTRAWMKLVAHHQQIPFLHNHICVNIL